MHIPVIKYDHHIQLPLTPSDLTMLVTKFGVSVEKVVATIDVPNNHQGSFRPDRKYSCIPAPARRAKYSPVAKAITP